MEQATKRKLAAILMADVVGYSRLMGDDEAGTVRTLKTYRGVFSSQIERHDGRVVNAPGDSILAEFGSVVDSVAAAVEIQRELAEKNQELPSGRAMQFRIGINLGDVIVEEDAIYGDGVNIAARLESLADPGGIAISHSAFDQVDGKLPMDWEYTGEHNVKNIGKPVRAYRLLKSDRPDSEADSAGLGAMPAEDTTPEVNPPTVPDKPSIAVLPFANLSGDQDQEYFGDGLAEDIITDLSRITKLEVFSRNSTFAYKGRSIDLREVGRDLGASHILEGSVRKAGNQIRVTAQLIDASTGHHLWADRYDKGIEDVFAIQDEITREVVTALDVKLLEGEQARAWRKGTDNPNAYDLFLQARHVWNHSYDRPGSLEARNLFDQAILLDPGFAMAYVGKADTYMQESRLGWSEDVDSSLQRAFELANEALALDEKLPDALSLIARCQETQGAHVDAMRTLEEAVDKWPQNSELIAYLGRQQVSAG